MNPYYQTSRVAIYNNDFRELIPFSNDPFFVFDPPYNIGFDYDVYSDSMPDNEYIEMLSLFQNCRVAIIQYPEEMQRLIVPALGPPDHSSVWCYNSNTSRRFRLINWYNVIPDYSRIKQSYKNPTDKRVSQLIKSGGNGTSLYEWWDDIQLVKNVSKQKGNHPCPIPYKLAHRIITLAANPGDTIIDPFAGSLTTIRAARDLGYMAIGCELSKSYIDDGLKLLGQLAIGERGNGL